MVTLSQIQITIHSTTCGVDFAPLSFAVVLIITRSLCATLPGVLRWWSKKTVSGSKMDPPKPPTFQTRPVIRHNARHATQRETFIIYPKDRQVRPLTAEVIISYQAFFYTIYDIGVGWVSRCLNVLVNHSQRVGKGSHRGWVGRCLRRLINLSQGWGE